MQSSFSLVTSGSSLLLIALILAIVLFSFFIYKYTIPSVSRVLRTGLVFLRTAILVLILFLIYEPIASMIKSETVESKTRIYIDNSNSIATSDSAGRIAQLNTFIQKMRSTGGIKTALFSFGRSVDSLVTEQNDKIDFTSGYTNFENIITDIRKNSDHINSAVIISDGIITDGIDPTYQAERLQIPLFTVGIGDSSRMKDIEINNVSFNEYVYSGRDTKIEALITNLGYQNRNTRVSLFEENRLVESKDIILGTSGMDKIPFNYKPAEGGEKKLTIRIAPLSGEATDKNNTRTFYLNVLDTKFNICLVAGTPSADVSAVSKAITTDKNIGLKKLIQISNDKFWNDEKPDLIDSADVLFLIDFPGAETSQNVLEKVTGAISQNKPFFFLLSGNVNFSKLNILQKFLPFTSTKNVNELIQVQPDLNQDSYSSNFSSSNSGKIFWDKLPPVTQFNLEFISNPGSNVLARSRIKNIPTGNPFIISSSIGRQRVFAILGGDIWRWQLQTAEKNPDFFDNFINDIVKWLRTSDSQKQFRIYTNKKNYSPGEDVIVSAELYDRTLTPIDTATISVELGLDSKKSEIILSSSGNGLYSGIFSPTESGDFTYEGSSDLYGSTIKSNTGRFNIGDIQIERIDTRMRIDFLNLLANSTGGNYYSVDNYSKLTEQLKKLNEKSLKESVKRSDYQLWNNEWLMLLIILLFSAEWFIRKRAGMI